ncbi:MAG: dihydrodipicolinate synthase family protein [Symbiobacterium sp.]|uniref:dihydrodipicolinate synthase family protein n=1 Tax=Symbiobacterium sp. TaxID=1971213 RepID=UPI003464C8D8
MKSLRGVFPILAIPFDRNGAVDEMSLRRLVRFELDAGVDGLGLFGMASEVYALSDAERDRVASIVMEEVGSKVPVIMGSGSTGIEPAVALSKKMERAGAACLMVVPPYWMKPDPAQAEAYFTAVAAAVDIPIQIQDAPNATGVTLPTATLVKLAREVDNIQYVKVETNPSLPKITEIIHQSEGRLAVFGGGNGVYMYEELNRGAVGTMPSCEFPDVCVRIWRALQAGDGATARREFVRHLPLMRYGTQPGIAMAIHKEILRMGGIFETATVRIPNRDIDETTRQELKELIADMDLLALRWKQRS